MCKCDVAGPVVVSYRIRGALCHRLVVHVTNWRVHPVLHHTLVLLCRASWCLRLYDFRFVPSNKVKWMKLMLSRSLCTHMHTQTYTRMLLSNIGLPEVSNFIFVVVYYDMENQVEGGGCWREPESPAFITFSFVTQTQQGVSGTQMTVWKACRHIDISENSSSISFSGLIPIIIGF